MLFKQLNLNIIKINNKEKGFTLIEVMIAMAIFAIGILGVAKMQINAISGNAKAREYSEASAFAQGQIESLMSTSFDNIVLAGNSSTVNAGGYTVQTTILNQADLDGDLNNDIMNIEIRVFDPSGIERSLLTFLKAANI